MDSLIIVNCYTEVGRSNYWDNELDGGLLVLKTHTAAAAELADAARKKMNVVLNRNREEICLFGPVSLIDWKLINGFFALYYDGHSTRYKASLKPSSHLKQVHKKLEMGCHLIICRDGRVDQINLESQQPSPESVAAVLDSIIPQKRCS